MARVEATFEPLLIGTYTLTVRHRHEGHEWYRCKPDQFKNLELGELSEVLVAVLQHYRDISAPAEAPQLFCY